MLNCPLCGTDAEDNVTKCGCGFVFRSGGPLGPLPASEVQKSPHYRPGESQGGPTPPPRPAALDPDGAPGIAIIGILLAVLGLLMMAIAGFVFDPTVESSSDMYGLSSRVYNSGLQQQQLMLLLAGCAFFVAGSVMWGAGAVVQATRRR